jgi:hypothetical protein
MITVRLMGGLGNQMFQYAVGLAVAKRNNTKVKIDLSWFDEEENAKADTYRPFTLNCFRLSDSRKDVEPNGLFSFLSRPKNIVEESFRFNPKILRLKDNIRLSGYWQTEKYFLNIQDSVRENFTFASEPTGKNIECLKKINKTNSISIHVRRGDYVTSASANSFHGTKGLDYYYAAIKIINQKVAGPTFFVFSDDPVWCKENLRIEQETVYIDHNSPESGFEDMRLMSACKHHIIANSSFSWWGAWLNPNKEKLVIAPKAWFNSKTLDTSDLIPDTWLKL